MPAPPVPIERLFADPPPAGYPLTGVQWHPTRAEFTYLERVGTGEPERYDLWAYELERGDRRRLAQGEEILPSHSATEPPSDKPLSLQGYQWHPGGERILLTCEGRAWHLRPGAERPEPLLEAIDTKVSPAYSPSGDRLAFYRGGDLWVLDLAAGEERRLTEDGSVAVLNGKLDWVYWEELGHRRGWRAFEWSPDGRFLAFLRLDQSDVPEHPLVDVMANPAKLKLQRYPCPGDANSDVSVRVVEVATGEVRLDWSIGSADGYVSPELAWTPDSRRVLWTRLTRDQRSVRVLVAEVEPEGHDPEVLLEETDPHWLNHVGPPLPLPDGSGYLWLSERTGRAHLCRLDPEGRVLHAVTSGDWQVERLHGADRHHVYFTAGGKDPLERHFCRARLDGDGVLRITRGEAVCTANRAERTGWALVTRSQPHHPPQTELVWPDGKVGDVIHAASAGDYAWGRPQFHDVLLRDGTLLHARLLVPEDFDPGGRYPVVAHVYGGPHAQVVQYGWAGGDPLEQLLVQEGILVWRLDNRGSWGRGHAFETPVNRELGRVELADQLAGVEYLRRLPFVDGERLGITGWSYGGFLTLYALLHAPEVWRCGAAGAPVTDWRLYDSIYTERYMGTPAENPEGYAASSILEAAGALAAPLLLIHGTDDDNVHPQHTLQLVEVLSRHRKPYELILQPKQKHSFSGEAPRLYVHERLLEFFRRHLSSELTTETQRH